MLVIKMKAIRTFAVIFSLIFLFLFTGPMITSNIINIGNIFGACVCIFVLAHCIFSKKFKELKAKCLQKGFAKFLWRTAQTLIVVFVVYAVAVSSAIIYYATISPEADSTVITLGAKVRKNNTPSRALKDRTTACYNYLESHTDAVAVLSGGKGTDENESEADCMYNILTTRGIDKERLIIEDQSTNTYENIKNSYELIKKNNISENLAITTDSYHQLRARIIAHKQGIEGKIGAVNASTYFWIYPTYFVREWFAIPVELIK
jgi:uncharacterized SAM-binding protein YcdF (DUF218 family)